MKNLLVVFSILLASTAHAHFEIGTYKGLDSNGSECSIEFIKKIHQDGIHNPLSERVFVKVLGEDFETYHPLVYTYGSTEISFNHDLLQAHKGTSNGAKVLAIDMSQADIINGPLSYDLVINDWRAKTNSRLFCDQLVFQN